MIIGFIKNQLLEISETIIVAESYNYLKAQFLFATSDWNGLEKTAYFKQGETTHPSLLDENNITEPLHLSAGTWSVSVVGRENVNGELVKRITTTSAIIEVLPFKAGNETPFPEATPTELERLFAIIGNLSDLATKDKTTLVNAINEIYRRGGSGGGGGADGISPIVEITEIEGGHRVTITDAEGVKSFDVPNGKNGKDGYTPIKGVDYFDGKDAEPYTLTEADKSEIVSSVKSEIPVEDIWTAINEIRGGIDEIEAMIDESGVLE